MKILNRASVLGLTVFVFSMFLFTSCEKENLEIETSESINNSYLQNIYDSSIPIEYAKSIIANADFVNTLEMLQESEEIVHLGGGTWATDKDFQNTWEAIFNVKNILTNKASEYSTLVFQSHEGQVLVYFDNYNKNFTEIPSNSRGRCEKWTQWEEIESWCGYKHRCRKKSRQGIFVRQKRTKVCKRKTKEVTRIRFDSCGC